MGSERAAFVREVFELINARRWDAVFDRAAADFEYDLTRTISPERGTYDLEGARRVADAFLGPWESAQFEVGDFIEVGDRVVTPYVTHFRGRDGIEVTASATWVWTIRDGSLTHLRLYQDLDEALADARAAEQAR
jgi:ketosteroid isomerase-like protein